MPKNRMKYVALSAGLLLGGVALFSILVLTRPEASKAPPQERVVPVETTAVELKTHGVVVRGQGEVVPAQRVELKPQVNGRVTWQSPELVPGGKVRSGQLLVRIETEDYQLAVEQQMAAVQRAQLDLQLERSRKRVAEREWELLAQDDAATAGDKALALREPQVRTARVALESAQSGLKQSQLNLQRTAVRAPFNALIQTEQVDLGQLVTNQTPVATLVGTDAFWVQVAIPQDQLPWVALKELGAPRNATAEVTHTFGARQLVRSGKVIRLLGDLDPVGRMARLLIEVSDPLGLKGKQPSLPLLLGSFVEVEIEGQVLEMVVALPRVALREGNRVYVVDRDGRLGIRRVEIAFREKKQVFVRKGLDPEERVITSPLATPVPGMKLRDLSRPPDTKAQTARTGAP